MRSIARRLPVARVSRRAALIAVTVALALPAFDLGAQRADPRAALPNLDVRTDRTAAAAGYLARVAALGTAAGLADVAGTQAAGLARLQADLGTVEIATHPALGTPEIVGRAPGTGFLTAAAPDRVEALRGFLATYADVYGLSPAQATGLELVASYANPAGNMAWVELQQRINGLPVFQGLLRGGFTARGELVRTTGVLGAGLDPAALATSPRLTAAQAVVQAAATVGWTVAADALGPAATDGGRLTFARGAMADAPTAWLLYFPIAPGSARLAWATEIWGDPDAFLVLLDAEDGSVLFRKNLTNYQTQPATYRVYTDDSPAPLSPTTVVPGQGTQAPFIARGVRTLIGNEAPNTFNNLGWMTDGTSVTDGNNVEAGIDRDGTDGVDAPVICTPFFSRVCDVPFDPQVDEALTAPYQKGEVIDTFYWTNVYHDRLYLLGFTEAAGNFQNDNFARGGKSGDRVRAESQDSSSINNANFSTPTDGGRGRMQMYLFPGPTPDRSSGIDHDVLLHELTHGVSNRLHSNAAGLATQMSAGMGEGWSDFYARALLSTADEDPTGIYASGGWVTYQLVAGYTDNYYYGIRRFPYASLSRLGPNGRPHNPLTFADVDATQINTTDGAFPRNPIIPNTAGEVHNVGEVWASALFEVRARFIARLGWTIGNQRILQFVTDGMKLDPVNPTMLQGRDAILAAADAGGGTAADRADIWAGFAARGLGVSAQVVNVAALAVVQAFDLPGITGGIGTLVSESIPNGKLDPYEVVSVSLCMGNAGTTTSAAVTGVLVPTGGVLTPSAAQSYGTVAPGASVCRTFTLTVGASCGASVTATLVALETGQSSRTFTYPFKVSQSVFASQDFDGVTAPALPPGWTTTTLNGASNPWVTAGGSSDAGVNHGFVADLAVASDSALVSPTIAVPAGATQLSFRHTFSTDATYDGGVLEIAIAGGPFRDIVTAGGKFLTGGYNGSLNGLENNPLGIRAAWTGATTAYITTTVSMPAAAAGQNVVLRWRMGTGSTTAGLGWSVDSIVLSSFACLRPPPGDLDGDRKNEITVFRPATGEWLIRYSATGYSSTNAGSPYLWGLAGDVPMAGDFDGDGKTDLTVYRPTTGEWFIRYSSRAYAIGSSAGIYQWGLAGDVPFAADFDGDGKTDLTVWRPSNGTWYIRYSSQGYNAATATAIQWGLPGDTPLIGDFDGDGLADPTVWRPSSGTWYILYSSLGYTGMNAVQWGLTGDVPITGDFDGDGQTDLTVWRPSNGTWYLRYSSQGYSLSTAQVFQWGLTGDVPLASDFDSDGKTDLAVVRPSTGVWYIRYSSLGYNLGSTGAFQWGLPDDVIVR